MTATGEFRGGRACASDAERFSVGYFDGQADATAWRRPLWRASGVADDEQAKRVPLYFAGYQAGRRDHAAGVCNSNAAWWRWQTTLAAAQFPTFNE
jgi:hypothetical protein